MKRSEVESALGWAKGLLERCSFTLPEFAYWTIDEWRARKAELDVIRKIMLGWDITDYGMGDFKNLGSVLFTIRNGSLYEKGVGTPYAEKVIPIMDGQRLPMHCHHLKTEDIINRGGGRMYMQLYNSAADGRPDFESDVEVWGDGIKRRYGAGEKFYVERGRSLSLTPGIFHIFGADEGDVLVGEVSSINDDNTDNDFYEKIARFSKIEEDVPVTTPLCNEYDALL